MEAGEKIVWLFDSAHTTADFSVRHMMISRVRGTFGKVTGRIEGSPEDWESANAKVEIEATSVYTREEDRDNHLRSADFLDVENHPKITFTTKKIEKVKGNGYKVLGDLTIRGTSKEVELDGEYEGTIKDPYGNQRVGFTVEGEINRQDFGLKWNSILETGGLLVGDQVDLIVHVEAVKQSS